MLKFCPSRKEGPLSGSWKENELCVLDCNNLKWSLYLSEVGEMRRGERSSGFGLSAIDCCLFQQILTNFLKQMFPSLPLPLGPFLKVLNSFLLLLFPFVLYNFPCFYNFHQFSYRTGQHSSSLYNAQSQSHHYVLEQAKQRGTGWR